MLIPYVQSLYSISKVSEFAFRTNEKLDGLGPSQIILLFSFSISIFKEKLSIEESCREVSDLLEILRVPMLCSLYYHSQSFLLD